MKALTMIRGALFLTVAFGCSFLWGNTTKQVTVRQVDSLGNSLAEETYVSTDAPFSTLSAPARGGYRFTHWSASPAQPSLVVRDAWGRALEVAQVTPVDEVVTLTANYLPTTQDEDADGIPDGEELYWYGAFTHDSTTDTDGDGLTFAQELQYGTNPLFKDALVLGGVNIGDSATIWYNPHSYTPYTIQTNTDGVIAVVETSYLSVGASKTTPVYSAAQGFAYWKLNGKPQVDAFGRALDTVTFVGTGEATGDGIIAEAVLLTDADARALAYWYGAETTVTLEDDTDGDGLSFAQEMQYGTNPLFKDALVLGGVNTADSAILWYNPNQYSPYTIQSDPAGKFETITGYLKPNTALTTSSYASDATFAYWTLNGVRQADAFGRAFDQLTLVGDGNIDHALVATATFLEDADARAAAYWYGEDAEMSDDRDGDGLTLAQELQYGTNPLFKDTLVLGGVNYGDGPVLESNLQVYDHVQKILVNGALTGLFAGTDVLTGNLVGGVDFGANVAPAFVDVDGDGDDDLLVCAQTATGVTLTLYKQVGQPTAPAFEVYAGEAVLPTLAEALGTMTRPVLCGGRTDAGATLWACDNGGTIVQYTLATDTVTTLDVNGWPLWSANEGFAVLSGTTVTTLAQGTTATCDIATEDITSAALVEVTLDEQSDLLIADTQGRISLYERTADGFTLRHRVWGGTYIGFAKGLAIAPVDWEADGDMDLVVGTAEGAMMLLSDPGVGRPTNLTAAAGYDNVLLSWNPSGQSRVSGYNVYRATTVAEDYTRLAEAPLPQYRDEPLSIRQWVYRVTSLVRRWTAGNSTPEVFESAPSETIAVDLGAVTLTMIESLTTYNDSEIEITLHIDNTMGLVGEDLSLTFTYDEDALIPEGYLTTAISDKVDFDADTEGNQWHFRATGGTIEPGAGEFLRLRFKVNATYQGPTTVSLTAAQVYATGKQAVELNALPLTTYITIQARPLPVVVQLQASDCRAESGEEVQIPVKVYTLNTLDWESATLQATYDTEKLTLVSVQQPTPAQHEARFTFKVLEPHDKYSHADIRFSGSAKGTQGQRATVFPAHSRVLIKKAEVLVPAVLSLAMEDGEATPATEIVLPITATSVGDVQWATLTVEAVATGGAQVRSITPPTLETAGAVCVFIPEMSNSGEITVTLTGSATSANGLPAEVIGATATLTVTVAEDPTIVPPWSAGDCDGDGRLTGNDYVVAFNTVKEFHANGNGKECPHTEEATRVHRALCVALGKPEEASLRLADVTNTFKKWLWARGVTDTNLGNGNGGKK
ncbi:MAG: hypothetical protein IKM62_03360 [Kiritimatiellae bacterium]|nr:hypothetical protein [Kiritimatiellia bacterium]